MISSPPATTTPAAAGYRWATGTPAWEKQELQTLSAQGKLSGVAPQIESEVASIESGFGVAGLAINATGYGGYFGEGSSTTGKGSLSRAQLTTPGAASFATQAEVSAHALASYGKTLGQDLSTYGEGGFLETYQSKILPPNSNALSQPATLTGWQSWLSPFGVLGGLGAATKATGGHLGILGTGALGPVGNAVASAWAKPAAELLLVAAGLTLVIFGLYKAAGSPGASEAKTAAAVAPEAVGA